MLCCTRMPKAPAATNNVNETNSSDGMISVVDAGCDKTPTQQQHNKPRMQRRSDYSSAEVGGSGDPTSAVQFSHDGDTKTQHDNDGYDAAMPMATPAVGGSHQTIMSIMSMDSAGSALSPHVVHRSARNLSVANVLDSCAVMVSVRVRPLSGKEKRVCKQSCLQVNEGQQVKVLAASSLPNAVPMGASTSQLASSSRASHVERSFTFDCALDASCSQQDVYNKTAQTVLQKVLRGFNGTVFAYGQTGSGKTYTMEGTPSTPGIIPQLCRGLFAYKAAEASRTMFHVKAVYVEIYQETLRDLLKAAPMLTKQSSRDNAGDHTTTATPHTDMASGPRSTSLKPAIREHASTGVFVENVVEHSVTCYEDVAAIIHEGTRRRTKGRTKMNEVSSRSHAVLQLTIEQQDIEDSDGLTKLTSQLNLCDLAGSERAKATGATGMRLKEASKINQSLSALGNVINALTSVNRSHVPYRDSKLTRLLQNSLGGNAVTLMICCVSPAVASRDETLSALRFAERAKQIKNLVRVNVDPAALRIAQLMEQNKALRLRCRVLEFMLTDSGIALSADTYADAEARWRATRRDSDVSALTEPQYSRAPMTRRAPNASKRTGKRGSAASVRSNTSSSTRGTGKGTAGTLSTAPGSKRRKRVVEYDMNGRRVAAGNNASSAGGDGANWATRVNKPGDKASHVVQPKAAESQKAACCTIM